MARANHIEVVCGLSRSGKTAAALERYAQQVREHGEDTALLILPTGRVVRQARERLVGQGMVPGLLDPRIFTFPDLAHLILNANHECATAIGPATQTVLLRQAIETLASAGELAGLAEVGGLPGFAKALGQLISDLKRAAVRPADFCAAMQQAGLNRPAHREIGGLYCAYQWSLICRRLFDDEGLFWLARDVLRDDRRRPLERIELMIVDGFTDFTTTQLDMLHVLARGIPQTLITLDHSPEDTRQGLAPWFRDTLKRLAEHLGGVRVSFLPADGASTPLAHLRSNLFTVGTPPKADAQGAIHLLRCPSPSREVREVLARIKRLLTTGPARPGDIAIVARDLAGRAGEIASLAGRLGVPVHVDGPRSPTEAPAVRAVLHAYETAVEDYRREDVLALLRSTCFTFEALRDRGLTAEDVAAAAEQALIVEGREQWLARLGRRPEHVAIVQALADIMALLPDPRARLPLADRVTELRRFIERTDLRRNAARGDLPEYASANLRALGQLDQALGELEHTRSGPVSASAFHALLRDLLDDLAVSPRPPAGECVSVLGAREARQLRFPITFVIGLCENEFPRRPREEPFLSVSELAALERAGVVLERRRGPEAYEPLLFYGAVASAERALWLTYASADVDGKPLQPSHYLREIGRLFTPETLGREDVPLSQVAPDMAAVANPRELAELAFFDLTENTDRESPTAYNALIRLPEGRRLIPRILDAADLDNLRDSPAADGPYVGVIQGALSVADLAARFGPEHPFTASDLTAYAVCPFDFLCQCVLRLTQPEYASADLDPRTIGNVRHAVLSAFARRRLESRPGRPLIAPGEEDEALAELEEIIGERFRAFVAHGGVSDEALWAIEQERCRRDMALWVHEEATEFGEQRVSQVEFAFGWREGEPVHLPGRADVRLRGRIDRLNSLAETDGFVLIDYKSGRLPTGADVKNGLDLQFPIYALGARAELPPLAAAPCVGWRYCRVTRPLQMSGLRKPEEIAQTLADIPPQIAAHVDAIRAGRFSYIAVPKCAERCPSAQVCRHAIQRRATDGEAEAADDDA
ncbi:MAG: hypothetical protein FJX75_18705 [Armatimonadetes bacterium]|nr:hypothetical protein [Armatimonadota bacterium]